MQAVQEKPVNNASARGGGIPTSFNMIWPAESDSLPKQHIPILLKVWPYGPGYCKTDQGTREKKAGISRVLYKNLSSVIEEVFLHG